MYLIITNTPNPTFICYYATPEAAQAAADHVKLQDPTVHCTLRAATPWKSRKAA